MCRDPNFIRIEQSKVRHLATGTRQDIHTYVQYVLKTPSRPLTPLNKLAGQDK